MPINKISDLFSASKQISPEDVSKISDAGFKVIICNRPDGEEAGQPTADEIGAACKAEGVAFYHLPFQGTDLTLELVDEFRTVMDNAEGPVFAYCRSGQRCAHLYENAQR